MCESNKDIEERLRIPRHDPEWLCAMNIERRDAADEIERLNNTIKNCPPASESEYVRRLEDEIARLQAIIASTRLPNCGCGRNETTVQLLKGSS